MNNKIAGLRIDVDTLRGTRYGVPALVRLLRQHNIRATFFFSVGPDNMGRHLWRLLRPSFFLKMLRSKAASLYGWDILLKGTLGPGPIISKKTELEIRAAADAGHEIGFHAWDHWRWQRHLSTMTTKTIQEDMKRGITKLAGISRRPVNCAAAPAWMITEAGLAARDHFSLRYCSDCRGRSIFYPAVSGTTSSTPQIPVTLPTYDELIGRNGINQANYNQRLLDYFVDDGLNVLVIHAEVEGICCQELFADFLMLCRKAAVSFVPLGDLLEQTTDIPRAAICRKNAEGRSGWLSWQQSTPKNKK